MHLNLVILVSLVAAALWTVMTRSLIRAAIGLALTSVILAIMMFRLNAALAAVFELSVCAGLISVLFVSTISMTHPLTMEEVRIHMKQRLSRFWYLPLILVILGVLLSLVKFKPDLSLPGAEAIKDVRHLLWDLRQIDLMGQVIMLLVGVFGVVVLFKERLNK